MSIVILQNIRFFVTTSDERKAGTDSKVVLEYWIQPHSYSSHSARGWQRTSLTTRYNARERAQTDLYEIYFRPLPIPPCTGICLDPTDSSTTFGAGPPSQGIAFDTFTAVRNMPFRLVIEGKDWWKVDHWHMFGHFVIDHPERIVIEGGVSKTHIGWLHMGANDRDVGLSTDPKEAHLPFHPILLSMLPPVGFR